MFFATDGNLAQRPNRLSMVLMVASLLSLLPSDATAAEPVLPAGFSLDVGNYLSMLFSLAVVLGLIVLVGWVIKRMQRMQRGGSANMEVIDVLPLGAKEKLLMVRAGDCRLLIALTPGRLSTLGVMHTPESADDEQPRFRIADHAA